MAPSLRVDIRVAEYEDAALDFQGRTDACPGLHAYATQDARAVIRLTGGEASSLRDVIRLVKE